MAFSIANFFSIFTPLLSKPPPTPSLTPSNLSLPTTTATTRKNNNSSSSSVSSNNHQNTAAADDQLMSVVCPSLAYANTLYFNAAYNVQVVVEDNEPEEKLLGRFRREVMKAGVIQECKRRRFFENKQEEKKRKTREAAKRNRRRRTPFRNPSQDTPEASTQKKDDDLDNWDMPEGGLPA